MKKRISFLAAALTVLLLSSCAPQSTPEEVIHEQVGVIGNFLPVNEEKTADAYFLQVVEACKAQDAEALTALFAAEVTQDSSDFAAQAAALLEFYDGSLVSYDNWAGPKTRAEYHGNTTGRQLRTLWGTYDVVTENGTLRFAIEICVQDTADPDALGIRSLYVIRGEDTQMQFAYWGDGEWKPGIVIE